MNRRPARAINRARHSSKSGCAGAIQAIRYTRLQQAKVNVVAAVQRQVFDFFTIYQSADFAARRLYQRRSAFHRDDVRCRAQRHFQVNCEGILDVKDQVRLV